MDDARLPEFLAYTAYVVVGGLFLLGGAVLPALRGFGVLVKAVRWVLRQRLSHPNGHSLATPAFGFESPVDDAGISPKLANLTRLTRVVALELQRWDREAASWPRPLDATRKRWLGALLAPPDVAGETASLRLVFEWLRSAETLAPSDSELLTTIGIDVAQLRTLATADHPAAERVRALAGALWAIDQRLLHVGCRDYRGSVPAVPAPISAGPSAADEKASEDATSDELEHRRQRWALVLGEHRTGLARLAARHARTPVEREDLEQDIALALWEALPRWRGESSLKTFAYTVARYCCFAARRRRSRLEPLEDTGTIADERAPEQGILSRDELARVEDAFERLPATLGSALALRLEGRSQAEIARELGISERNVSVRISRARKQLHLELIAANG